MIFFKIYAVTSDNGMGLQYMSGKRMIQPASEVCSVFIHHRSKIMIVSYAFLLNSRVFIFKGCSRCLRPDGAQKIL